jgi:hypothetical protein
VMSGRGAQIVDSALGRQRHALVKAALQLATVANPR